MSHLSKGTSGHLLKTTSGHLAKSCAFAECLDGAWSYRYDDPDNPGPYQVFARVVPGYEMYWLTAVSPGADNVQRYDFPLYREGDTAFIGPIHIYKTVITPPAAPGLPTTYTQGAHIYTIPRVQADQATGTFTIPSDLDIDVAGGYAPGYGLLWLNIPAGSAGRLSLNCEDYCSTYGWNINDWLRWRKWDATRCWSPKFPAPGDTCADVTTSHCVPVGEPYPSASWGDIICVTYNSLPPSPSPGFKVVDESWTVTTGNSWAKYRTTWALYNADYTFSVSEPAFSETIVGPGAVFIPDSGSAVLWIPPNTTTTITAQLSYKSAATGFIPPAGDITVTLIESATDGPYFSPLQSSIPKGINTGSDYYNVETTSGTYTIQFNGGKGGFVMLFEVFDSLGIMDEGSGFFLEVFINGDRIVATCRTVSYALPVYVPPTGVANSTVDILLTFMDDRPSGTDFSWTMEFGGGGTGGATHYDPPAGVPNITLAITT